MSANLLLSKNGHIDNYAVPDDVDEGHVVTDSDLDVGLVNSESERRFWDNGYIYPTGSQSDDPHGFDVVSPPVTDDGRCGAATITTRPRTDRPQPRPENARGGLPPKRAHHGRNTPARWSGSRS